MKYQFIEAQRDTYPVQLLCRVMGVARSGYYKWRAQPVSKREMANQTLTEQIRTVHQQSDETYGSPRVYQELLAQGIICSQNRVARLMRQQKIAAKGRKRYKVTTKPNRKHPTAPNLLGRQFTASRPDETWLTDITYIRTREGWLFLAAVLDLYSRRVVGWSMGPRMTNALVIAALKMALGQRRPPKGLLHHSDQGSQYTSSDYQQLLQDNHLLVSMNRAGSYYDNAPMESFFASLKRELLHHRLYHTRAEAKSDIFCYLEVFYNRRRRHSSLDYLSPVDFEQRFFDNLASVPVH